jgi:hypothetical protein
MAFVDASVLFSSSAFPFITHNIIKCLKLRTYRASKYVVSCDITGIYTRRLFGCLFLDKSRIILLVSVCSWKTIRHKNFPICSKQLKAF